MCSRTDKKKVFFLLTGSLKTVFPRCYRLHQLCDEGIVYFLKGHVHWKSEYDGLDKRCTIFGWADRRTLSRAFPVFRLAPTEVSWRVGRFSWCTPKFHIRVLAHYQVLYRIRNKLSGYSGCLVSIVPIRFLIGLFARMFLEQDALCDKPLVSIYNNPRSLQNWYSYYPSLERELQCSSFYPFLFTLLCGGLSSLKCKIFANILILNVILCQSCVSFVVAAHEHAVPDGHFVGRA